MARRGAGRPDAVRSSGRARRLLRRRPPRARGSIRRRSSCSVGSPPAGGVGFSIHGRTRIPPVLSPSPGTQAPGQRSSSTESSRTRWCGFRAGLAFGRLSQTCSGSRFGCRTSTRQAGIKTSCSPLPVRAQPAAESFDPRSGRRRACTRASCRTKSVGGGYSSARAQPESRQMRSNCSSRRRRGRGVSRRG